MLELLAEQREGSAYPVEDGLFFDLGAPSWLMLAHFSYFFLIFFDSLAHLRPKSGLEAIFSIFQ